MAQKIVLLIASVGFVFSITNCTRKDSDISKINLNFPAHKISSKDYTANATTDLQLSHIIINISGLGIAKTIEWQWDQNQNFNETTPPSSIQILVPVGENRLFQAIAVYENENMIDIHYGDATKSIYNLNENIDIIVKSVSIGTGKEYQIYGRYLNNSSGGPTDNISLMYQPPNNKPKMRVMRSAMINGWFKLFSIDGVNFDIISDSNKNILMSEFGLNSNYLLAGNNVMYIDLPNTYYEITKQNNTITNNYTKDRESENVILAFLGPNKDNRFICYEDTLDNIYYQEYNIDTNSIESRGFYIDEIGSELLQYSTTSDADAATNDKRVYISRGGVSQTSGECSSDLWNSKLNFKYKYLKSGVDAAAGIRGPYKIIDPNNATDFPHFVNLTYNNINSGLNVSWQYLPNALDSNNGITGTALFFHNNYTEDIEKQIHTGININCNKLSSLGFTEIGASTTNTFNKNITLSLLHGGEIILCPYIYKDRRILLNAGVESGLQHQDFLNTPPIKNIKLSGPSHIGNKQCHAYKFNLLDDFFQPIITKEKTSAIINILDADNDNNLNLNIFSDVNCSTAITNNELTIEANTNGKTFYIQIDDTSFISIKLQALFNNNIANISDNLVVMSGPSSTITSYKIAGPNKIKPNVCANYAVFRADFEGYPSSGIASNVTINSTDTTLNIYNEPNCLGSAQRLISFDFTQDDYTYKYFSVELSSPQIEIILNAVESVNSPATDILPSSYKINSAENLLSLGMYFNCALNNKNGQIKCWGVNNDGQLGIDNKAGPYSSMGNETNEMGINLPYLDLGTDQNNYPLKAKQVVSGDYHACALLENNKVKCWGKNIYGQAGIGATTPGYIGDGLDDTSNPTNEMGNNLEYVDLGETEFLQISAGSYHTCGITTQHQVKCWGKNYVEISINTSSYFITEDGSTILDNVAYIDSGFDHNCAILYDNTLYCWGQNTYGQLGTDSTTPSNNALYIANNYVDVKAAKNFTCGIQNDGTSFVTKCWGDNMYGQLAIGSFSGSYLTPQSTVIPADSTSYLSASYSSSCAIISGITKCWGFNSSGQLGIDSISEISSPMKINPTDAGTSNSMSSYFKAVFNGENHTCGMFSDGSITCWGNGSSGQIGRESTTSYGKITGSMETLKSLGRIDLGF